MVTSLNCDENFDYLTTVIKGLQSTKVVMIEADRYGGQIVGQREADSGWAGWLVRRSLPTAMLVLLTLTAPPEANARPKGTEPKTTTTRRSVSFVSFDPCDSAVTSIPMLGREVVKKVVYPDGTYTQTSTMTANGKTTDGLRYRQIEDTTINKTVRPGTTNRKTIIERVTRRRHRGVSERAEQDGQVYIQQLVFVCNNRPPPPTR